MVSTNTPSGVYQFFLCSLRTCAHTKLKNTMKMKMSSLWSCNRFIGKYMNVLLPETERLHHGSLVIYNVEVHIYPCKLEAICKDNTSSMASLKLSLLMNSPIIIYLHKKTSSHNTLQNACSTPMLLIFQRLIGSKNVTATRTQFSGSFSELGFLLMSTVVDSKNEWKTKSSVNDTTGDGKNHFSLMS